MSKVTVNDQEFDVGSLSAMQILTITKIVGKVVKTVKNTKFDEENIIDSVIAVILSLEEDDLIALAASLIGSDMQFAKENFNLVWVTEALAIVLEETDMRGVIQNFTRITSRLAS